MPGAARPRFTQQFAALECAIDHAQQQIFGRFVVQAEEGLGAEIVGLLKTGSAYYAPSASVIQMVAPLASAVPGWANMEALRAVLPR